MLTVRPDYRVRFMRSTDAAELVNLYHLARTALSGRDDGRHARMLWACREFHRSHIGYPCSETGLYKDLCGLLS